MTIFNLSQNLLSVSVVAEIKELIIDLITFSLESINRPRPVPIIGIFICPDSPFVEAYQNLFQLHHYCSCQIWLIKMHIYHFQV